MKILQICSCENPNAYVDEEPSTVHGMGDDGRVYIWDFIDATWCLYQKSKMEVIE